MVGELCAVPLRRRLEQMLKRYERGELAAVDWLDTMALARIRQLRTEVRCSSRVRSRVGSKPHMPGAQGGGALQWQTLGTASRKYPKRRQHAAEQAAGGSWEAFAGTTVQCETCWSFVGLRNRAREFLLTEDEDVMHYKGNQSEEAWLLAFEMQRRSTALSEGRELKCGRPCAEPCIYIVQEEQKASSTELSLEMELPVFAHAVIWQQAAPAPAPALAPPGSVGLAPVERGGPALTLVPDPEVRACAHTDEMLSSAYE